MKQNKIKHRLRKRTAIGISMILTMSCCHNNILINADELVSNTTNIQVQTDAPNLIDNYTEDSILCDKLEYDVKNNATELKDNVEEELNRAGVFDEEINELDDETINELNKSINTTVYINYISVDEKNNGAVRKMKDSEIDDVIEQRIEENKIHYEEDKSLLEEFGESIGIIPENVDASEPLYEDWNHPKTKNKVKQTIYACQFKKKGKIYVTAKAYWLKEAYYRNVDVFGVYTKNCNIIRNSAKCKHTATCRTIYKDGRVEKEALETHPTAGENATNGVAFKVNLFGDRGDINLYKLSRANEYYREVYYDNEYIEIKFQCRYESKYVVFATSYYHSMTNRSITPSISVSGSGISVGISSSSKKYYVKLSYNAYMDYKHI